MLLNQQEKPVRVTGFLHPTTSFQSLSLFQLAQKIVYERDSNALEELHNRPIFSNQNSDHSVLVLDVSRRKIPGKRTTTLPDESGRNIRVALPEGRLDDIGSIIVVATRDDIPFISGSSEELLPDISIAGDRPVLAIFPTYQDALDKISGWLAGIPLEKRAFDIQQHRIIKRN